MQSVTKLFALAFTSTLLAAPCFKAVAQTVPAAVPAAPEQSTPKVIPVPPPHADASKAADETPIKPAQPKSKLDPPLDLLVETGYSDWLLSGSRNKFQQYATMPSGFFLKDLYYVPFMSSSGERLFTSFKGIGGTDYRGDGRWDSNYGATQVSGFFTNNRFFEDTPDPINASSRHSVGFNVRQMLTRSISLDYRYRDDIQQNLYDSPNPGENQDTKYQDVSASGKLGNGFFKLSTANLKFTDNTGTLLNSNTQTMAASYLWTPIERPGYRGRFQPRSHWPARHAGIKY